MVLILRLLKTFHCRAKGPGQLPPLNSHIMGKTKITNCSFGLQWAQSPRRAAPCRGKMELCVHKGACGGAGTWLSQD